MSLLRTLDIDVSTDGGSNWTNVLSWNEDHPAGGLFAAPGEMVNLDITALAAGQPDVKVRFHYYETINGFDWYAQVDCFSITGCPSGGACCSNGPGIETECFITDQADCETNHKIFLGAGSDCTADVDCDALAATMDWMEAKATDQGVEIRWQTALEVNTAGFRVLRETLSGREKSRQLVAFQPAMGSNGIDGASYMVLDAAPEAARATAYIIQEVDAFGRVTDFPPIQIDRGARQQPQQRRASR